MWENYRRITVNRDHAVVIAKSERPGSWFAAGIGWIAPLYRKQTPLIGRAKWIHIWTIYTESLDTSNWATPAAVNSSLHFQIEIRARQPTGWYFTIPPELRRKNWLPEAGGIVFYEYGPNEANIWTEETYNEESILQSDSM